mmetsp:Transcript_18517/g.26023  ORF Transcript_18517/g.26023 Transcript_18517/m.26023 type:complete len:209 (-) Transcript_18517:282-908(-)
MVPADKPQNSIMPLSIIFFVPSGHSSTLSSFEPIFPKRLTILDFLILFSWNDFICLKSPSNMFLNLRTIKFFLSLLVLSEHSSSTSKMYSFTLSLAKVTSTCGSPFFFHLRNILESQLSRKYFWSTSDAVPASMSCADRSILADILIAFANLKPFFSFRKSSYSLMEAVSLWLSVSSLFTIQTIGISPDSEVVFFKFSRMVLSSLVSR